jgi:CubicO group peptidase (beta-lactamase class C family)
VRNLDKLDALIERILRIARIPGAAIAVCSGRGVVFAKGYGCRDLAARLPVTPDTIYPIASTTKAMTATLIGMLVDDGLLDWDTPVRNYLPRFQLRDPVASMQTTLRDLFAMRVGLPRHDWVWEGYPVKRSQLIERLQYLEFSAAFRERFQYNNMLITVAGHIAEAVTARSWESLVQERLFNLLGMGSTGFGLPTVGNVTSSYHEDRHNKLILTRRLMTDVTGPSGGSIHSTVEDMSRWASFNLLGGEAAGRFCIKPKTLSQVHSPQIIVGSDATAPTPTAAYAMGWFIDTYNGHARVAHGGYLHDVSSDVALFPEDEMGIVSFTNFGCPLSARLINQHVFDVINELEPAQTLEDQLAQYQAKINVVRERHSKAIRIDNAPASHPLKDYAGVYSHPGYGDVEIKLNADELILQRHSHDSLILPLEHWHYDTWVAKENDVFLLHEPNPFDASNRLLFGTDVDGKISTLVIRLEPAVEPIVFEKQ